MTARTFLRRATLLGAALALAIPAAAQARDVHALDDAGNLLRVDSRFPGVILDETPLSGLPSGVSLVGIDVRSTTGGLVGVGTDSVVYSIDANSGAATAIGSGFAPGLTGTAFGLDVNPVPDALRVTSDQEMNFRLSFATGGHGMGSPDRALNPGDPSVVGSAYTNAGITGARPAGTTLYAIDQAGDRLLVQAPPNDGTLGNGKALGIDAGARTGFDIADGIGYLATNTGGAAGSTLYRVDLNAGTVTELGAIGTGSLIRKAGLRSRDITSIAVRQPVIGPPAVNAPPAVSIVATTPYPKPRQKAAYIAQATDGDGSITKVEWDTDGDGRYDLQSGASQRIPLTAGAHTIRVRATDNAGARTVGSIRVQVGR